MLYTNNNKYMIIENTIHQFIKKSTHNKYLDKYQAIVSGNRTNRFPCP